MGIVTKQRISKTSKEVVTIGRILILVLWLGLGWSYIHSDDLHRRVMVGLLSSL